uniref:Uncharacterized protein n=1 Tax=Clytia hemisphaerica TaxID=252671 RepID=A0A7M6DLF2_9CNID
MIQPKNIVFITLSCVVLGLFLASCWGVGWAHWKVINYEKTTNVSIGIWEECVWKTKVKECNGLPEELTNIKYTRGCAMLAVFTSFLTFVFSLAAASNGGSNVAWTYFCIGLIFAVTVCLGIISGATFTIDFEHFKNVKHISYVNYGWAYTLNWVGTIVAFLTTILSCSVTFAERNTVSYATITV